jgi:type IV secretory pathway TrbD component
MDDRNETKTEHVPPHETTASPVEVSVAMPRYFGITPPTPLFGVASATLAVAIVLAILEHWLAALVLAAVVLLEIALFLSVARRKPDTVVARVSTRAVQRARERMVWLLEATSVRTEAGRRLTPLRRELLELTERQERLLRDLGSAVYEGDDEAAKRLTGELNGLDEERQRKEAEMTAIAESAKERLQEGRMRVQPTKISRPEDEE